MDGHGVEKFKDAALLASSANRPWSAIAAELRSHQAGEIPPFVPTGAEITMIVREDRSAISARASGGVRQIVPATPGTIWLCPSGISEEETRLSEDIPEVLHIYLPNHLFQRVKEEHATDFISTDIRYEALVSDVRLRMLLNDILSELREETFAGGLRVDQLATDLIAILANEHAERSLSQLRKQKAPGGLDRKRLRRVTEYIEAHLYQEVTLQELARAADYSVFHFTRAFARSVGYSPQGYITRRRLDQARGMLIFGAGSLTDIADLCRFSSQSSFSKAFHRLTGMSPGRYRQRYGR